VTEISNAETIPCSSNTSLRFNTYI